MLLAELDWIRRSPRWLSLVGTILDRARHREPNDGQETKQFHRVSVTRARARGESHLNQPLARHLLGVATEGDIHFRLTRRAIRIVDEDGGDKASSEACRGAVTLFQFVDLQLAL